MLDPSLLFSSDFSVEVFQCRPTCSATFSELQGRDSLHGLFGQAFTHRPAVDWLRLWWRRSRRWLEMLLMRHAHGGQSIVQVDDGLDLFHALGLAHLAFVGCNG